MSGAVCSRKPLGQPVVGSLVLVVGGRGGFGGTSGAAGVLRRGARGAPVTLMAMAAAPSVPVRMGAAVEPLAS